MSDMGSKATGRARYQVEILTWTQDCWDDGAGPLADTQSTHDDELTAIVEAGAVAGRETLRWNQRVSVYDDQEGVVVITLPHPNKVAQ